MGLLLLVVFNYLLMLVKVFLYLLVFVVILYGFLESK